MREAKSLEKKLEQLVPNQVYFSLKEACAVKHLNYKTACNRTNLQPNGGIPDTTIGGRKLWNRESILSWIVKSDEEMTLEV